ncbi:MAG TPA: hypothetical protein VK563_22300 [Puia sp.]|nr:hypothetical protein [Puia sp.]
MRNRTSHRTFFSTLNRTFFLAGIAVIALTLGSCTTVNVINYYSRNRPVLDSIERSYKAAYRRKPFSIEFTERSFNRISLELMTDSLKYIYEFGLGEGRMRDTLLKYGFDDHTISSLIGQMRSVHCAWVNNLDYYVNEEKRWMVYISIWPQAFNFPFVNKRYNILTYFSQPQYFDDQGRLLTGRRIRRIRKINAEVFRRINDTVCYTLSDRFR